MNTTELKLWMLSTSVTICIGAFTALVLFHALGIDTPENLNYNVRIFIGMVLMAIFLNSFLRLKIKELESEDEDNDH